MQGEGGGGGGLQPGQAERPDHLQGAGQGRRSPLPPGHCAKKPRAGLNKANMSYRFHNYHPLFFLLIIKIYKGVLMNIINSARRLIKDVSLK